MGYKKNDLIAVLVLLLLIIYEIGHSNLEVDNFDLSPIFLN